MLSTTPIYIGAAYYPEMWDISEIDKDIERCKSVGINTLRIGEFAWSKMEPKEGEFCFDWLESVVDKLYENGIYTVMCTPSATPPRWLLNKYTETRMVMHDLIRADVSSRCHTCKTSSIMREKNRIIVTEMAKRFARHPGIVGWQLDNEIYPYTEGCYCDNCKNAFRSWLKNRFTNIETLNKEWGMTRWSLNYDSFEDIEPPYPRQWKHPSLRKAWRDFHYDQVKSYLEEQADVLHSFGCKNIGTNMMTHNSMSYAKTNEKLDVVQYNHYDTADKLADTAFAYDFIRSVKDKPFWVMETQANWNGSEYAENGYRNVGNCYVNTFMPVAYGGEMNLYWLFRTHPNGHEIGHGALYSSAGREHLACDEIRKACADISKCEDLLTEGKINSKIALHYSSTALNSFESAPLIKGLNYRKVLIENYYSALRHYNVDVIDTEHSLDGYEVVISPFLACVDEEGLKDRVIDWVKKGGTWIVGPMSDIMNTNVTKYTYAPYGFIEELAGVYTKYQYPIDNDVFDARWTDGSKCSIGTCFDAYICNEGTKSLVKYNGNEFDGLSVIAERNVGDGRVIIVGSVISHDDINNLIPLPKIAPASDNVLLTKRDNGVLTVIEAEHKNGYVVLEEEYTDALSGKRYSGRVDIEPYQILVLSKSN